MITQQEDKELARCRRLIEEKVGLGRSEDWSTQDFEQLGERIADQTGIALSVTTLKRVWGRVRYDSSPTATTLNTLVQFVGYPNWPHFKEASEAGKGADALPVSEETTPHKPAQPESGKPFRRLNFRSWWIGSILLAGLAGLLAFFLNYSWPKPLSPADFSFSSQPITQGIPNSVVFHYDATAAATDSVFIQQSWDPRRRQLVPNNGHTYTSIYYYPGYFRAKLVIGNTIVQEHNLLIPSNGWNVAVMQNPVPVYFGQQEAIRNGALNLPVPVIEQHHIQMQPQSPTVQYRYVREFNNLRADNFVLETRVKNTYRQGSSVCQQSAILILCKNEFFAIPLSAKGCVGDLSLYLAGHQANSGNTDLSALGVDLSQWVTLRCEVRNKHLTLFIDDRKAYEATLPNADKDIVGISYEFKGSGAVDFVRFKRPDGSLAFEDDFNTPTAHPALTNR